MTSVFTFETDPPRVSSPWLHPTDPDATPSPAPSVDGPAKPALLSQYGVTKLEAEPQDGSTEYKLHLLLRHRRAYTSMTSATQIPGSQRTSNAREGRLQKQLPLETPPISVTNKSRKDRLYHLTTQLLWRLQESSPYKANRSNTTIMPQLPDDTDDLAAAVKLAPLCPGLEESRGALYEIGVADDGTLIGLTKDEMDESLLTLQVMAASLGCGVEVLRMIMVGECEWMENPALADFEGKSPAPGTRRGKLWVAEAFVTPDLRPREEGQDPDIPGQPRTSRQAETGTSPSERPSTTDQLRITLTGPTTSGKSTLLGTLSTGTLDNGHGKSRLSLLKHRHELVSGVTSSVAQELIGYKDGQILNYAHPHIESWVGIHDFTHDGRLVFVSDSAGHPRYRRTILRGLVGWAPHWTILCLPGDDGELSSQNSGGTSLTQDILEPVGAGIDLAKAHLELCLKLGLPLAVVITKLDLATKSSLQRTVGKALTAIKAAGRIPKILPGQKVHSDPTRIPSGDDRAIKEAISGMMDAGNILSVVPIILTSAVKGVGFGLVHALLENLPLPPPPTAQDYIGKALNPEQPTSLFHIEDKFSLPASYGNSVRTSEEADLGTVIAGYLRFGSLAVGDRIVIGPFHADEDESRTPEDRPSPGSYGLSISHPSSAELSRVALRNAVSASTIKGEWHWGHIVSIRNLRLPVQKLESGQVGTIGLIFDLPEQELGDSLFETPPRTMPKIRKGMVLAIPSQHMNDTGLSLQAASGLTAVFSDPDVASLALGSLVNIYVASVRASARILRISATTHTSQNGGWRAAADDFEDIFGLNEHENGPSEQDLVTPTGYDVRLELFTHREWIELGSQVLILEGGSKDKSGLEGFVGKVVEVVD
ncbi:GTP-binding protein [Pleurostoma richardsiae]|uniref:GTP-binding protein n=1 Tax=Pleurostoma richardsiae TaxID=41990 RepID=A0AA38RTK9_9PEZI|nr:GTP-binding protein [Pleurostoma richardsiae]